MPAASGDAPHHVLVIGAQRCGTTYLRALLAEHPQIAMAEPARPEPKVFLDPAAAARGSEWYAATYFPHAAGEPVRGEKSTSYLEDVEVGDRAVAMLGDARFLVQLRDPVERAVSHWAFSHENGLETRPLAEALTANLAGPLPWDPERTSVSPYAYLERGRYADALRPWLERWPDRVRVQFLEHLTADADAIGATYRWLSVDPTFRPAAVGVRVNESRPAPPLGSTLREALRDHFRAADEELAALVGAPLPWSDGGGR